MSNSMTQEIICPHCGGVFYLLNTFRVREAKTVSCLYCKKQIVKKDEVLEGEHG